MKVKTRPHQDNIEKVISRLASIARRLRSEGLGEQAKSLDTTIADLGWQRDELRAIGQH